MKHTLFQSKPHLEKYTDKICQQAQIAKLKDLVRLSLF